MDGTAPKSLIRRLGLLWLPVVLWAALIFWLSAQSQPPEPEPVAGIPGWPNLAHFGLYLVLGAFLFRAIREEGAAGGGQRAGDTPGFSPGSVSSQGAGAPDLSPGGSGSGQGRRLAGLTTLYLLTAVAGALYAASDELHQSFVPERQMDVVDWSVDLAGILVGSLMLLAWQLRSGKN